MQKNDRSLRVPRVERVPDPFRGKVLVRRRPALRRVHLPRRQGGHAKVQRQVLSLHQQGSFQVSGNCFNSCHMEDNCRTTTATEIQVAAATGTATKIKLAAGDQSSNRKNTSIKNRRRSRSNSNSNKKKQSSCSNSDSNRCKASRRQITRFD